MPVYEYFCPQCYQEFEVMRPVSQSDEPASCPQCAQPGQKLVSVFATPTGFYLHPTEKAFRKPPPQG